MTKTWPNKNVVFGGDGNHLHYEYILLSGDRYSESYTMSFA